MNTTIFFCFIFSSLISCAVCYNVAVSELTKLQNSHTEFTDSFGYDLITVPSLRQNEWRILISSSHQVNEKSIYNNTEDILHSCSITRNLNTSCQTQQLKGIPGTLISVSPEQLVVKCNPREQLECFGAANYVPGKCYRSQSTLKYEWHDSQFTKNSVSCKSSHMDVMFVLDGSESIGKENFETVKKWVKDTVIKLNDFSSYGHYGVIQYSHWYDNATMDDQIYIKTAIELGKQSVTKTLQMVDKIELHGYTTYTGKALWKAKLDFKKHNQTGHANSDKILILLTDGRSNDPQDVEKYSKELRSNGVISFAVGVGENEANINRTELRVIATGNVTSDKNVEIIKEFSDLTEIIDELKSSIQEVVLEGTGVKSSNTVWEMEYGQVGFATRLGKNKVW